MAARPRLDTAKRRIARVIDIALAPIAGTFAGADGNPTVAGLFGAASGIGESARLCFDALRETGHDPDSIDLSAAFRQDDLDASRFHTPTGDNAGPLILHINPPELPRALRRIGRQRLAGRKIVGYWAWELPRAPTNWIEAMRYVHEVWTPSAFCTDSFPADAPVPVRTVPHIVPAQPRIPPNTSADAIDFHVIASGDARSSLTRKNLDGAVRAFRTAFDDDPAVRLSVRLGHGSTADPVVAEFERRVAEFSNIRLVTDLMDEAQGARYIASADVLLSLHRSEGFGLVLAKAMRMGRPVIATGWSGNMEFMTPQTACLIGFEMTDVADPQGIYRDPDQVWADPDVDEAATWLRRLRAEPELRAQIGDAAAALYPAEKIRAQLGDALGRAPV